MKKFFGLLEKLLEALAAIFLAVFCLTTFAQVVARFVFKAPLIWSEEAARYAFIYMVFLGCAVGVRRGTHYSFDIFGKMKNHWISAAAKLLTLLFETAFFGFLLYTSLIFIPQMNARASSILRIPVSVPYFSIILFSMLGLIFVLEQLADWVIEAARKSARTEEGG